MRKVLVTMCLVSALIMTGGVFASEKSSYSGQKKGSAGDKWGNYGSGVDKAAVQAAILNCIHKGNCPKDQICTIEGVEVKFDYLHAGVKEKKGLHVSCADFVTESGDTYDLDYYVKKTGRTYKVVKKILHKKNAKSINKVLCDACKGRGNCCKKKKHEHKHKSSGYKSKGSGYQKKGSGY